MITRGLALKLGLVVNTFAIPARVLVSRAPDWKYFKSGKVKVLGSRSKGTW